MAGRRGRRTGPRPKGICPACGQLRHLRDSGGMGMHHRLARGHYNIGVCRGVDQPPRTEGPEMASAPQRKAAAQQLVALAGARVMTDPRALVDALFDRPDQNEWTDADAAGVLAKAVDAVLELHKPVAIEGTKYCGCCRNPTYPCATVQAITTALGATDA